MTAATPNRPFLLSGDRPLEDPAADLFGHGPFAKAIATSLLRDCPPEGLVIGIYGSWGLGKSTALNFLERYLVDLGGDDPPIVVRFNPWWFSGQDDLMRHFFGSFESAVFKARAAKRDLKKKLAVFASAFGAIVSEAPVPGAKAASKGIDLAAAAVKSPDVVTLKMELVQELRKIALRIVIIMDDIDRLAADEVRLMFRLVKAVADFPNVTYVLAFDREVTGRALEEFHPSSGQDYLEKIIQVPFELPIPDREQLTQMLFRRLERALGNSRDGAFDQRRWAQVYADAILPFIAKPRDVLRLANALSVTHGAVAGEVNLIDFIALETWRVLEPPLYEVVRDNPDHFTGMLASDRSSAADERERDNGFHEAWLKNAGGRAEVYKQATRCVFPRLEALWGNRFESGEQWRRELRACSADIFPVFFRLSVSPHSISQAEFSAVVQLGADATAFGPRLLVLAEQRRPDGSSRARLFLDRLNDYLRQQKAMGLASAPAMIQAILDVADELVEHEGPPRGFDFGIGIEIQAVVSNLIALVPETSRFNALRPICEHGAALEQLTDCVALLAGQHGRHGERPEPTGERQLTELEVIELERTLGPRLALLAATDALWRMRMPLRLLFYWRHFEGRAPVEAWVDSLDDGGLARLLELFVTKVRMGDRRDLRLETNTFEAFFDGGELLPRVEALLQPDRIAESRAALELVAEHLRSRAARHESPAT
jgi:predicted KAP-like P-loop ATPase